MTKFSRRDNVGYQRVSGKLMEWVMMVDETNEALGPSFVRKRPTQTLFHQEAMNDHKLGDRSYYRYRKHISNTINRPDLLSRMTSLLRQEADTTRVLILQAEAKNLFLAISWLDASSKDTMSKGLITISDMVKRREDQLFETSDARIRFVYQRIEEWNRPWLLVMDNYDHPDRLPNITECIPKSMYGSVLVTTRQADLERLGTVVTVPPMSKEESLQLLYDRCGNVERSSGEQEHATEIVEMLGHLPLTIDQAGAYIRGRLNLSLTRFVKEYDERKKYIWSKALGFLDYNAPEKQGGKGESIDDAVFPGLPWYLSRAIQGSPSFSLLGECQHRGLPRWLHILLKADGEWDRIKLEELLNDFKKLSLVQLTAPKPDFLQVSLHPLVSEWIKYRTDLETRKQCLYEAMSIVKSCLDANLHDAKKRLLSVDAQQQIFRHQVACMENLQHLQKEDSNFMKQSLFLEYPASQRNDTKSSQPTGEATRMLQEDTIDSSIQVQPILDDWHLQQELAILDRLSEDNSDKKQVDFLFKAMVGTGQWSLDSVESREWLCGVRLSLWLTGDPGHPHSRSQIIGFLYAQVFMDELSRQVTYEGVRRSLEHFPRSLDQVYGQSLRQVQNKDSESRGRGMQILRWLGSVMRPLYVRELQHAILSKGLESPGDFLDEDALIDTMSIYLSLPLG
ncbi:MAG: hypothetical protein Q9188_005463 [Gyalolechia gomerana]